MSLKALRGYEVAERLAHYSATINECVEWTGYRDKDGYGHMTIDGHDVPTHRVAYELANGPISDGMMIRHTCDNPPCLRPSHLLVGFQADNSRDMVERNRAARGSRNGAAALTESDIPAIRNRLRLGESVASIANDLAVGTSTISRIKGGKTWTHV